MLTTTTLNKKIKNVQLKVDKEIEFNDVYYFKF